MDLRRAALVAVLACCLVASATILAGFAVANGTSGRELAAARAAADGTPIPSELACPPRADDTPPTTTDVPQQPQIVGLYPNPTTDGNAGEFVVLEVPPGTRLEALTLTDGHTTATLPNEIVTERIAVSSAPNVTKTLTELPVLGLEGNLRLANDGDDLRLRNATTTIDAVSYDRVPVAERWYRTAAVTDKTNNGNDGQWWPRDATCLPVSSAEVDEATAFVLPDGPEVPRETVRNADERLLLAGYTVTSDAIAADLVDAVERGVDVSVL
ncbi:phospholipase, partial [Natrinema soli]